MTIAWHNNLVRHGMHCCCECCTSVWHPHRRYRREGRASEEMLSCAPYKQAVKHTSDACAFARIGKQQVIVMHAGMMADLDCMQGVHRTYGYHRFLSLACRPGRRCQPANGPEFAAFDFAICMHLSMISTEKAHAAQSGQLVRLRSLQKTWREQAVHLYFWPEEKAWCQG